MNGVRTSHQPSRRARALAKACGCLMLCITAVASVEVGGVSPAGAAPLADRFAVGEATGEAARATANVPRPDDPAATRLSTTDIAISNSTIEGDGLGAGTKVADGFATPARSLTNGVTDASIGKSDSNAAPNDSESHSIVSGNAGPLSIASGVSNSSADTTPKASNNATVAAASVTGGTSANLSTTNASSSAIAAAQPDSGSDQNANSTASSAVSLTGVSIGGLTVSATVASSQASATATGVAAGAGASSASASCTVANLTVKNGLATLLNLGPIPCDGRVINVLVLKIQVGQAATSTSANAAAASITGLTLSATGAPTIELGIASANAGLTSLPPPNPCNAPIAKFGATGTAEGDVVQVVGEVSGVPAARVDLSRSSARFDEAGVDGLSDTVRSVSRPAQIQTFQPPLPLQSEVVLVPAYANAPPDSSQSFTAVPVPSDPRVQGSTVSSSVSATSSSGFSGTADTAAQTLNVNGGALGLPADLGSSTLTSTAKADKAGALGASASAGANVQSLTGSVAGIPVSVQALQSTASATAPATPGSATAAADYTFVNVTVGTTVVTSKPAFGSTITVGPLQVTFGARTLITDAAGNSALATIDALSITTTTGPKATVIIGRSMAGAGTAARGGAAATLCKDVDIHADGATFGDDGRTAGGHQRVTYKVCAVNTGTSTLTNVVVTDAVDPRSVVLDKDDELAQSGGTKLTSYDMFLAGGTLRSSPISLAVGASRCYVYVVELRDTNGLVVPNAATLTADGGTTAMSNTVLTPIGRAQGQPILVSLSGATRTVDALTKTITFKFQLTNLGAGNSFSTAIDQVLTSDPTVTVLTPLPINLGTLAPNQSVPVTVQVKVPSGATVFNLYLRPRGTGDDGLPYAFGLPFPGT